VFDTFPNHAFGPTIRCELAVLREKEEPLRDANVELAQRVADLQRAALEAKDAQRAALNLIEDAVHSRANMLEEIAERHAGKSGSISLLMS
jgi:hypothetical protein